jgi:hypothetical protein
MAITSVGSVRLCVWGCVCVCGCGGVGVCVCVCSPSSSAIVCNKNSAFKLFSLENVLRIRTA